MYRPISMPISHIGYSKVYNRILSGCSWMCVMSLDIFCPIAYSVSMEERLVRHFEQKDLQEEIVLLPNVPAPMVERTFRLLELLSTSEDGLILSDLSRALHASKVSVHGLVKTLDSNNVIEQGND